MYYSVPLPAGMEEPAGQRPEDAGQLSIINDITGAFRPNVLTAFMGETGAGKVTPLASGRLSQLIVHCKQSRHAHMHQITPSCCTLPREEPAALSR